MNTLSFFNPRFTSDLFDVIDRNFSDFEKYGTKTFVPRVDVIETKENYELQMDLPGMTEKDIIINLKDREISISSSKKDEKELKNEAKNQYLIHERFSSEFSRSFTLPDDIDGDNITAKFQNGLLSVNIPRKPESKIKRISVCA